MVKRGVSPFYSLAGAHTMETDSGIILAVVLSFIALAIGWRA